MGKRSREKTDEEIQRKIKRLEWELDYRKTKLPPAPQAPQQAPQAELSLQNEDHDWDSAHASQYNYHDEVDLNDLYPFHVAGEGFMSVRTEAEVHACPSDKDVAESSQPNPETSAVAPHTATVQTEEDSVPDEIMDILGEAKKSEEIFGKKIPQGVSERLGKILTDGLDKDQKETLLTKALIIPENFQLAKAPKLNAEVASVLNDPAKNRDKRLERLQNQLGLGIAGLVNLTTELINKDLDKMHIIKRISEVNQVLLDLHYEETTSRRRLVIPMLDQKFINIIQKVKRDQYLFGDNLCDNIKTSKSIEKSSLQIKKPAPPQASTGRKPLGQAGNSRAPARHPSGPAAARAQPSTSRFYPQPPPLAGRAPPPPPRRAPPPPPRRHPQDPRSRRR